MAVLMGGEEYSACSVVIDGESYKNVGIRGKGNTSLSSVAALCSFVDITVNGEDWGLYLAVEGVEEAFLRRNYGSDYGELYKPDSMSFGGGRLDIPAYPARSVGADTSCRVGDRVQIQEVVICTKRPWNLKFRGLFCLRMFPKHETVTEKF